jgi:Putative transposase DNA-binding domain
LGRAHSGSVGLWRVAGSGPLTGAMISNGRLGGSRRSAVSAVLPCTRPSPGSGRGSTATVSAALHPPGAHLRRDRAGGPQRGGHGQEPPVGAARRRGRHGRTSRQVEYKAAWSGMHVHIADRWYPSSNTCSGCGVVKAKLRLSERVFTCSSCGMSMDRDLHAAGLGEATSSPSCGATVNEPDGNPRKTHAVWAAGIATGRPAPTVRANPGSRKAAGQDTPFHVS